MNLLSTLLKTRKGARDRRRRRLEALIFQVRQSKGQVTEEILEIRERLKAPRPPETMAPNNDKEATFYVV